MTGVLDALAAHARERPDDPAYVFLPDRGGAAATLGFGALRERVQRIAGCLAGHAEPGDRAVLLFPPGLDFIAAFLGCLAAGIVAVPTMLPRRLASRDASAAIIADCAPRLILAPPDLPPHARTAATAAVEWVSIDRALAAAPRPLAAPPPEEVALLQYSSGSTAAPKGVLVSHRMLAANLEMIRLALGNTQCSTHVCWVPHYHDMGLVLNLLQTLYVGAACVLMTPAAFLRRPLSWLRAIHDYRAEVASAPNFAFDLCVDRHRPEAMAGIDLSCWKVALNGAEPVRAATLDRFAECFSRYGFDRRALYPAYGLAEATVMVAGGRRGEGPVMRPLSRAGLQDRRVRPPAAAADAHVAVGCGRAVAGLGIAIVEPESRARLAPGTVGEIWVAGANVAPGYWRNPEASAAVFGAKIEGEDEPGWLRTGDLGFVDAAGELFVTGRIKDLVIIRGINHYPQDIEATVESCHPALARHGGAVFAAEGEAERLVVVQEIERDRRRDAEPAAIVTAIREALYREHDIAAHDIVLIRPGGLPMTTSGKVQRRRAQQLWRDGALDRW